MSTTWHSPIVVGDADSPPETPSHVQNVDLIEVLKLAVETTRRAPGSRSTRPAALPHSPIVFEFDEDGQYIASDPRGAVYGVGPTESEAVADFERALTEHLAFLREHRDELSPRLESQLHMLERLFPDH
jgi:predicted RNase H-like HicB family nuclease